MAVVTLDLLLSTCRFSKLPPVAVSIFTTKFSVPSTSLSSMVAMLNVVPVLLAGIFTVVTPVKSSPFLAVPL
ncbi:hypothetical protein D3C76_1484060 [compost metagenome]